MAVDLPDGVALHEPDLAALPSGWDAMPTSHAAQTFGDAWLASGAGLAMKVPSAIVHEEASVVVNPRHADYAAVELTVVRPFAFGQRMFKRR